MSAKAWKILEDRGLREENGQFKTLCPAHADKKQSLQVMRNDKQVILLRCFAGCATVGVVEALGIKMGDLWPEDDVIVPPPPGKLIATYDYVDEQGATLYQVLRYDPKAFKQRRANGTWKLGDVRRVLYRLPQLLASDRPVVIVEGEKDVHNVESLGFLATTVSGGVEGWRSEFADVLRGRVCILLPDDDDPGRQFSAHVATWLPYSVGLQLPGLQPKQDVSDWIASGGTAADLRELVRGAAASKLDVATAVAKRLGAIR